MRARWWYRGEKEQNINKIKVLKQNLCFQRIFLRGFKN